MANQFFIKNQEGDLFGPFSQAEIKHEINQGSIVLEDYISKTEQGPWITVKEALVQVNQAKRVHARKEADFNESTQSNINQSPSVELSAKSDIYQSQQESESDYSDTLPTDQQEADATLFDPHASNSRIDYSSENQKHENQKQTTPVVDQQAAAVLHEYIEQDHAGTGLENQRVTPLGEIVNSSQEPKTSIFKQSLNYLTLFTSLVALLAIGGYYYTHDVLNLKNQEINNKNTENSSFENPALTSAPSITPVNLTSSQANLLHEIIEKGLVGENVVDIVNELSSMKDEKKVALSVDRLRLDLSRLKTWADENRHSLTSDPEVQAEINQLINSRELAITIAESLQFAGYIPWMAGNDKFSRQSNARAEKIVIVKVYQPKVDDNMKLIPWVEKLLASQPVEIPGPIQKGIFSYYHALDWARHIDQLEQKILKRLKELL